MSKRYRNTHEIIKSIRTKANSKDLVSVDKAYAKFHLKEIRTKLVNSKSLYKVLEEPNKMPINLKPLTKLPLGQPKPFLRPDPVGYRPPNLAFKPPIKTSMMNFMSQNKEMPKAKLSSINLSFSNYDLINFSERPVAVRMLEEMTKHRKTNSVSQNPSFLTINKSDAYEKVLKKDANAFKRIRMFNKSYYA